MPHRPSRRAFRIMAAATAAAAISFGGAAAQASEPGPAGDLFEALADAGLGLPPTGDDGRVVVDVYAEGSSDLPAVQAAASGWFEVSTVSEEFAVLSGTVDPARLDDLRTLPGVRSATVATPPVSAGAALRDAAAAPATGTVPTPPCRSIPVEADAPLTAAAAREVFGVDGSGVTVGIISDSFDAAEDAATTPDQDVRIGSLPGAGNPCGYLTDVTVVRDATPGTGEDEGRAMAQLVHGIAPGAELLFANAGDSMYAMAEAVDLLVAAGADVIVDDISFYGSPMFQEGPIDAAIARARDAGVSHYTSAGNSSRRSPGDGAQVGSWSTSAFAPTDCPEVLTALVSTDGCMNFGTGADPDPTNRVTYDGDRPIDLRMVFQWEEPWYGVETPMAVLALTTGEDPQLVGAGMCANTSTPPRYTCDQSLAHLAIGDHPALSDAGPVELDLVVTRVRNDGVEPGTLPAPGFRLQTTVSDGALSLEHDASGVHADHTVLVGPTLSVNNAGPNVFTVGAAPFDDPTQLRSFSAFGPTVHLFEPLASTDPGVPAAPLAEPWVRSGPDAVSIDGVRTSFFFGDPGDAVFRFTGTSAAAPHAAAIAALVRSARLGDPLTVEEEFAALRGAGAPVFTNALGPDVAPENAVGGGLVDTAAALYLADAATDDYWAAPVPPDEVPATVEDLEEALCLECAPLLPSSLSGGVLTVDGSAIPGAAPGEWMWLIGYSEPVNLGWVALGDDLSFTVDVSSLGTGTHTVALFHGTRQVLDEQPILIAATRFEVLDPSPGSDDGTSPAGQELPATGAGEAAGAALLALAAIGAGAALAAVRRRSSRPSAGRVVAAARVE